MRKKFLAVLLALCMIVSLVPATASAASFDDTDGHWGESSVSRWADAGILKGDGTGNFQPDKEMTRAEFAQMLCNLMGYTEKAENTFSDVSDSDWFADAILKLNAAGVMSGVGNGMAAPNAPISREQAAVMLCRALHISPSENASIEFSDAGSVSSWAKDAVAALTERGMINGVGDNTFAPALNINRASVATLVDNMVAEYITEDGAVITGEVTGVVIIKADNVTFQDATLSENVIVAPAAADATVTLSGTTQASDVMVAAEGATLVVEENAAAGSVTVGAPNAEAQVDGKADAIVVSESAEGAKATVSEGAEVSEITVAAPNAETNVAGKVDAIAVTETAEGAKATVAKTAEVTDVSVAAPNAETSISGAVSNVDVADTATGASVTANAGAKVDNVTTAAENVTVNGAKDTISNVSATGGSADVKAEGATVSNDGDGKLTVDGNKDVATGDSTTSTTPGSTDGSSSTGGSTIPPITYPVDPDPDPSESEVPQSNKLTFAVIPSSEDLYGKHSDELGAFTVGTEGRTVTVGGSATYITGYTGFSSKVEEQSGNYLPLLITVAGTDTDKAVTITGSTTKTVTPTAEDREIGLVMRLNNLTNNSFTVAYDGETYTVNVPASVLEKQKFTVTVTSPVTGGTVTATPSGQVAVGTEVTVSAVADDGYVLDGITVTPTSGTVTVTDNKFTMPAANVTVTATFKQLPTLAVEVMTSGSFGNKSESDLQSGISLTPNGNTIAASGISKKVTGWTGFSSVEAEQEGYYIWLKYTLTKGDFDGATVSIESKGEEKNIIPSASGSNLYEDVITRIADATGENKKTEIELTIHYGTNETIVYKVNLASVTCLPDGKVAVSFDSKGGSVVDPAITDGDGKITAPTPPTKTGYEFGGWYTEDNAFADDTKKANFDSVVSTNTTYYAKWTAIEYTITYDADGGTGATNGKYTVADTITLPTVTKDGYTFGGWFDNENLTGTAVTTIPTGSTGDKTFYAKWTLDEYDITYENMTGAQNPAGTPTTYTVNTDTITLPTPTKTDYIFEGWYGEQAFTTKVTEITKGTTGDKTFYAKWAPVTNVSDVEVIVSGVARKLGVETTDYDSSTGTISYTVDKAKFEAAWDTLTADEQKALEHEGHLYVRVNFAVPDALAKAADQGAWTFVGSTDNGTTWRDTVQPFNETNLNNVGLDVTLDGGKIVKLGQWFGLATVTTDSTSGDTSFSYPDAKTWTILYKWTDESGNTQYTTFKLQRNVVEGTASNPGGGTGDTGSTSTNP